MSTEPKKYTLLSRLGWLLGLLVFGFCCCCPFYELLEIPFVLLLGWLHFPIAVFPQMWVEPAAVGVGLTSLAALVLLVHGFARWLYARMAQGEGAPRVWRFRWSLQVVALTILLFVVGICLLGVVHEVKWLATAEEPLIVIHSGAVYRVVSQNNLKQLGIALLQYEGNHQRLPPAGTFDARGVPQHSWITLVLPYMEDPVKPDLSLPWNHPDNAAHFHHELRVVNHPRIRSSQDVYDAAGHHLAHYAANGRMLRPNAGIRVEDITDGTSDTILIGEVSAGFKPWGDPTNFRDPAAGLGASPEKFGSPNTASVVQFLMADGSVRALSSDTDPEVLKALSTPAGGEALPRDWGN